MRILEKEEEIVMKEAKKLGLDVEKISPKKVQELQPDVSMDIASHKKARSRLVLWNSIPSTN